MDFIWKSVSRLLFQDRQQQISADSLAATSKTLLVAAIDFGTTYSGCAFSFYSDPNSMSIMKWSGSKLLSYKGPTCVLIKPDGKTLDKFGFDAEQKYSQLSADGEHTKWYFFRRFKMMLWNKKINKGTMLDDECGKSLPARTVFSLSIRFMMEGLKHMYTQEKIGLNADDIHWMLTVPAIWDDSAKSFMRLAAQEGGISPEKLTIVLEPEAASIYCRHMPAQKDGATGISSFRAGKQYLVLDAGGGTIDITVHEVLFGGEIKELYKATGGAWGGTVVDQAFLDFIGELIGKDILEKFKNEEMEDYIELLREFEHKKRETDFKSHWKVTMRLPIVAISGILHAEKRQTLQQIIDQSVHAGKICLISDKIRLDNDLFRSFFKGSVDSILHHLSCLLRKPETSGVKTILMVGGYSESPLLQEAIQNKFPSMRILVPQDAVLAVLKGAVLFGHYPTSIKSRVSKYTYGWSVNIPFDDEKHPLEKLKLFDCGIRCCDIFSVLVKSGQTLVVGENQYVRETSNSDADQKSLGFEMFCTSKTDVTFVTDNGCKKVGSFVVPLSGSGLNRYVIVRMMFGGTELMVECEEKSTGKITRASIDFLL